MDGGAGWLDGKLLSFLSRDGATVEEEGRCHHRLTITIDNSRPDDDGDGNGDGA